MTCPEPVIDTRLASRWTRREALFSLLFLALVSAAIIGTYIPDQEALSPFDEWVYLDYVDKATDLQLVQQGELIGEEALEVSSCRGLLFYGPTGSPCGGPYRSAEYPLAGVTSADIHPPTYFVLTATVAAAIRTVGLSDDLLTSARIAGALWLLLGLLAIVVLARELGAPLLSGLGAATVAAALPITRYNNSYITPDALNIAVGAVVLLAAVRFAKGAWPWWALAVAGVLAGSIKTQNGLAVGVALVFLSANALVERRSDLRAQRGHLLAAGGALAGYLAAQVGWLAVRSLRSLGEAPAHDNSGAEVTLELIARETTAFILRLGLGATEDGQPISTYAYFLTALLIAGFVGAVLYRPVRSVYWQIGAATTAVVFIGSPVLLIAQQAALGEVVPSPARYGSALIAAACVVTAGSFSTRLRSALFFSAASMVAIGVVATSLLR